MDAVTLTFECTERLRSQNGRRQLDDVEGRTGADKLRRQETIDALEVSHQPSVERCLASTVA